MRNIVSILTYHLMTGQIMLIFEALRGTGKVTETDNNETLKFEVGSLVPLQNQRAKEVKQMKTKRLRQICLHLRNL